MLFIYKFGIKSELCKSQTSKGMNVHYYLLSFCIVNLYRTKSYMDTNFTYALKSSSVRYIVKYI